MGDRSSSRGVSHVTYLGHFPPFSPITFTSPHTPPSRRLLFTTHKLPPTTTNHHQSLPNRHSRQPSAHTHPLRPPHSSPPHHFSFPPNSITLFPNLHNPTFIVTFLPFLTTARSLYKHVVASGLVFLFFCRGVGLPLRLVFATGLKGYTPPARQKF